MSAVHCHGLAEVVLLLRITQLDQLVCSEQWDGSCLWCSTCAIVMMARLGGAAGGCGYLILLPHSGLVSASSIMEKYQLVGECLCESSRQELW